MEVDVVPFLEFPEKFHKNGDTAKANQYSRDIHSVMNSADFTLGAFTCMVKSGEVAMTQDDLAEYPICHDEDTRPRSVKVP